MKSDAAFKGWRSEVAAQLATERGEASPAAPLLAWLSGVYAEHGALDLDAVHVVWVLDQIELTERLLPLVLGDLQRTTGVHPVAHVDDFEGQCVRVTIDDDWRLPAMSAAPFDDAEGLVDLADYFQDLYHGGDGPAGSIWPVCPRHGYGLHAELTTAAKRGASLAVWHCRPHEHDVAIGRLGL